MSNPGRSIKAISVAGCLVILAACSTPSRYLQASQQSNEIEKLAAAGKCDQAIKSFDNLKKEYSDQAYQVTKLTTTAIRKLPQCLINAGRAQEVVQSFELVCLSSRNPFTAQEQTYICNEYDLKNTAALAYQSLDRENPFEKNSNIANQIARNGEYISQVEAAISSIYQKTVTGYGDVGTSAGARRYYSLMKSAAAQSIALVDAQVPKCQAEKNALCLKFLAEKRRDKAGELTDWSAKLNESEADREAAQKIAGMAPAILGAVGAVGVAASRSGVAEDRTASRMPAVAANRPAAMSGWTYDDMDHGRCVSIKAFPARSGSAMAYGHYELTNSCAYPIKLLVCTNTDRVDGRPSEGYEQHRTGAKCPGGWGGTELQASQTKDNRTWFEYNNIKFERLVCRIGWSFVGADGESFPQGFIGERYRCRKRG